MDNGRKRKQKRPAAISSSMLICLVFAAVYFGFSCWLLPRPELGSSSPSRSKIVSNSRPTVMYERLLALAAHALAEREFEPEPPDLWKESLKEVSAWKPCAHMRSEGHRLPSPPANSTGYILVDANGGLNQQRVAICNAVAVARLLNATLVLPRFQFSNVWRDDSQFGDIYQEDVFIGLLKEDVNVVKQLPVELESLDLQAIGSFFSDLDVEKEAKPSFYIRHILPILLRNRVVLFSGFGNRLTFDPIPFDIQRLRCRCNFHALKFNPRIQTVGKALVQRLRKESLPLESPGVSTKYLAVHLRFEIDMVAYSMCDFGGGDQERAELDAYRKEHFPMMPRKSRTAETLREEGQCPLSPEEAVLMLAALGFKRRTRIFLAGAHIYGGQKSMVPLASLYPDLVTKEDLMTSQELSMFANHSSQLAALDFIVSAAADAFAMTDSGSQLSSLVSGFRMYFGYGKLPTIRPNKRRLAAIFSRKLTVQWEEFEARVRKTVQESKKLLLRPVARSVYRHPRCPECMCKL